MRQLSEISGTVQKLFLALVCVEDREICCLSYENLLQLVRRRKANKNKDEDQYTILVTAPKNKSLKVYVNAPGVKGKRLGDPLIAKRKDFPDKLFD